MKLPKRIYLALGALAVWIPITRPLMAQDTPVDAKGTQVATEKTPSAATNAEELRKESQNPIASLISVPFQDNWNFAIGPANRAQNVLNIQPVIPFSLGKDWNLITRWITPIVYQPIPVAQPPGLPVQQTGVYGLGDLNPSFFFSPKKGKVTWGVGPTFLLPTATNTAYLGQGKFGIGPSVVVLSQPGHWTLGFLANNIWSVAGHADFNPDGTVNKPPVNQFLFQWFVNYNLKEGWYLKTAPIITANWRAPTNSVWNVPFGGGVGRVVNLAAEIYGNAVHPPGASSWTLRLSFVLLFPKLSKEEEKMLLEERLKQMNQTQPQEKK